MDSYMMQIMDHLDKIKTGKYTGLYFCISIHEHNEILNIDCIY